MFFSLKNYLNKSWFNLYARGILDSPPVRCDPASNLLILTQSYHPDLYMYLLAAKSFARFVQPRGFVVVDDGLTARDRALIEYHLGQVRFVPTVSVELGPCPAGGTWERLLTIARLTAEHYVIQLDADTLTLNRPDEVIECIRDNRPFTLGTSSGKEIVSVQQACEHAIRARTDHVQSHAEQVLSALQNADTLKYVRGCSGFAGFSHGGDVESRIHSFSTQMEQLLGAGKWREWGSEQVTSNFTISNLPGAIVLSPTRYPFWKPGIDIRQSVLVHFFGPYRFSEGMYVQQARKVCHQLRHQS